MTGYSIAFTDTGIEYAVGINSSANIASATDNVVVCLHGIGGDHGSFAPQLTTLSGSWKTVAWCMPGYRQSAPLAEVTFDSLVTALEEFRVYLGCSDFHLVGQSIGGMIAQQYAHQYPERVRSLSLIATTTAFGGRDDSFRDAFLKARLKPLDEGRSMPELAAAFVPEITGPSTPADCLAAATESMAGVAAKTYRNILNCLVTFDQRLQWPTLNCPLCLIAGSVDNNAPSRTMLKMAERNPNAEFHEIDGAGHLVNLEKPDETNVVLVTFLHKVDGIRRRSDSGNPQ